MNIGFISCVVPAIMFGLLTLLFLIIKEKGAVLISGFNAIPKEKRELYDTEKMSKDQRNAMLRWTNIMSFGALLCVFVSQYVAIIAYAIWLFVFFKDVHFDSNKAFDKYKK